MDIRPLATRTYSPTFVRGSVDRHRRSDDQPPSELLPDPDCMILGIAMSDLYCS